MPYAELVKTRMVINGIRFFPEELCATKISATKYSFPVCGDILRRILLDHSDLEFAESLEKELDRIYDFQAECKEIASLEDTNGDERLFPFQRVGVKWLRKMVYAILADEPGMGKTCQSLKASEHLKKQIVVCSDIKMKDWSDETHTWTSRRATILTGSASEKERILESWEDGYLIMNYDSAMTYWHDLKGDCLIVDEAHHLRNKKTGLAKYVRKIARKVRSVFLLTATPVINFIDDIWTLLNLVDPKRFPSYWSFVFRFCEVEKGYFGIKVGGLRESEIGNLNAVLSAYCLQRPKSLMNGPHRETYVIDYELTGLHKELYDQLDREGEVTWQGITYSPSIRIARDTRKRQLAIHPGVLFPDYEGPSKLDPLLELINIKTAESDYRPIIVFTSFAEVASIAVKELSSKGVNIDKITGKQTRSVNARTLKRFSEGAIDVLIVTHKTGGEGLNLIEADTVIYLDLTWHPSGNQQASERIDRPGQTAENIDIIMIHAVGTIEDHVSDIVREKNKISFKDIMKYRGGQKSWKELRESRQ